MSFLTVITLTLFTVLVVFLYLYFKWSYTYWSRRGVTTPLCSFPLGNLNDVAFGRVSVQEMFKKLYTDLKPKGVKYSGFYFMNTPVLVVLDLELIKSVLVKDFAHFTDHGLFDKKDYDPFGGHLFSLKGLEWKTMREKLTPLFTSGKLKVMFSTIENCSFELIDLMDQAAKNSEKVNIQDIAGRYTTDVIASVGFGIESNSLKNPSSEFRKYGERAVGNSDTIGALNLVSHLLLPDLVLLLKIPGFPYDVTNFFLEIVKSTIKFREENHVVRKDFMQLMIQLRNNIDISDKINDTFNLEENSDNYNINNLNGKIDCSLSIEDIAAQTLLFFVAGYDTSSITIAFCLYELANQPNIQEKVRDEIKTVLNEELEGKLSYNAIMKLTYMEKCIKETLRKYPIISSLFRRCTKTYQVLDSDLVIEKDMIVMIPAHELHYDSEFYPDPEKFDPERFSSENIKTRNTFSWLPFGEGPRVCIGLRLGIVQIKIALVKLLNNFRYSLDSKTNYPVKRVPRSFVIKAEGGLWLNVEKIVN